MTRPSQPLPTAAPTRARSGSCAAANCAACDVRSLTFCAGLKTEEVGRISSIVTRLSLAAYQMLFHKGDPAEFV